MKLLRKVVRDVGDSCPERPGRPGGRGRPVVQDVPIMPGPMGRKKWMPFGMNAGRAGAPAGIIAPDISRPGQESGTTPTRFDRDVPSFPARDVPDGDMPRAKHAS